MITLPSTLTTEIVMIEPSIALMITVPSKNQMDERLMNEPGAAFVITVLGKRLMNEPSAAWMINPISNKMMSEIGMKKPAVAHLVQLQLCGGSRLKIMKARVASTPLGTPGRSSQALAASRRRVFVQMPSWTCCMGSCPPLSQFILEIMPP